jgi:anion-transporting  ArsA/GET3 family ATPase
VRYFLDATPGLKELLFLGKVINLVEDSDDEIIIVDMPATGHGLAMLGVPNVVIEAVHAGPLRRQAEQTFEMINDPDMSAICFVTLAEELASTETIELYERICKEMNIAAGPVIANGVHMPLFSAAEAKRYASLKKQWADDDELSLLIEGAELATSRAQLNERYIEELADAFKVAPIVVPFLFVEAIDRNALAQISDSLGEAP